MQHSNSSKLLGSKNLDLQSIRFSDVFDSLDQQTKTIITALLDHGDRTTKEVSKKVSEQTLTLMQLVRRLEVVNEDQHQQTRAMVAAAALNPKSNSSEKPISAEVEMFAVSQKEEENVRGRVQNGILKSLTYPAMTHRYEQILEAYQQTFDWMFASSNTAQVPWSNFVDWLENHGGIYWVNGKAGSGKSTLLKYIFEDGRTRKHLKTWAGNVPLCSASFFFWNSGTPEQKSQTGLMRALVYEILRQYPDLIPIALPLYWSEVYSREINKSAAIPEQRHTLRQLMDIFKVLTRQTIIPLKLCLFIDGLDEFDGDHEEIAELFSTFATVENIKLCLSSRPLVVFQDTFRSCSGLRLQDLTQRDIEYFVTHKMHCSSAFKALSIREPEAASALIHNVVRKADGVFLWVKIVVKSLINGMRNRDRPQDLQLRLDQLPREIEPLYEHLFSKITPNYLEWASKAFQIVRAARDHYKHLSNSERTDQKPLCLLEFLLAIDENIEIKDMPRYGSEALKLRCEDANVHLTARCAGFLEVWTVHPDESGDEIQYLHRTARDYIERSDVWAQLLVRTSHSSFDPAESMLKSRVSLLTLQHRGGVDRNVSNLARSAMIYAYYAYRQTQRPQTVMLDHLGKILAAYPMSTAGLDQKLSHAKGMERNKAILCLAVMYDMAGYIGEKMSSEIGGVSSKTILPASLLYFLMTLTEDGPVNTYPQPSAKMVSLLLENGGDPNERYFDSPSAWESALMCINRSQYQPSRASPEDRLAYIRIMSLLVKAGADPQAFVINRSGAYSALEIVSKTYLKIPHRKEVENLIWQLKARGGTWEPQLRSSGELYTSDNSSRLKLVHHTPVTRSPAPKRPRRQ
jgi:NACHT domain